MTTAQIHENSVAKDLIAKSGYTIEELISDYIVDFKRERSDSFAFGWCAARGLKNSTKKSHIFVLKYIQSLAA